MLSEIQKNKFNATAKKEIKKLLEDLKIEILDDDTICNLQSKLDIKVASLVSAQENGEPIDEELLEIYDLFVDIVLDNEENLDFLNKLFFN